MFYTYRHIRLDTNTPFYVGKGKGNRAYSKANRNQYWHNIAKRGYEVEIMLEDLTEQEALNKEMELIKLYKSLGYCEANLTDGGEGSSGRKWLEESRLKAGLANKGKKRSEASKKKMSLAQLGNNNSLGHKLSKELKLKITEDIKDKPTFTFKGKKHTEETKQKNRKSHLGKKHTEETKQKMSDIHKEKGTGKWNKGQILSDVTKQKISISLKGKKKPPRTKEHIRKIIESRLFNKKKKKEESI